MCSFDSEDSGSLIWTHIGTMHEKVNVILQGKNLKLIPDVLPPAKSPAEESARAKGSQVNCQKKTGCDGKKSCNGTIEGFQASDGSKPDQQFPNKVDINVSEVQPRLPKITESEEQSNNNHCESSGTNLAVRILVRNIHSDQNGLREELPVINKKEEEESSSLSSSMDETAVRRSARLRTPSANLNHVKVWTGTGSNSNLLSRNSD
jgi:hypothetical protein